MVQGKTVLQGDNDFNINVITYTGRSYYALAALHRKALYLTP